METSACIPKWRCFYLLWCSVEEAPVPQGFVTRRVFIHIVTRIGRQSYLDDNYKRKRQRYCWWAFRFESRFRQTWCNLNHSYCFPDQPFHAFCLTLVALTYTHYLQCWCCQTCPQRPWCHSPADRLWSPSEGTCHQRRWSVGFRCVYNGPRTGFPERPTRSLSGQWCGCRSPGLERAKQRGRKIKQSHSKCIIPIFQVFTLFSHFRRSFFLPRS